MSVFDRVWTFTRPTLKKWRNVRSDSSSDNQFKNLLKAAFKKDLPACLVADNKQSVMALVDTALPARRRGLEVMVLNDYWLVDNYISAHTTNSDFYRSQYLHHVDIPLKHGRATTGWGNSFDTVIGGEQEPEWTNQEDLRALAALAKVIRAKEATDTVVNDLDMLVSSLLGKGFGKKTETWGWRNSRMVTMEYKDVTVTIQSKEES